MYPNRYVFKWKVPFERWHSKDVKIPIYLQPQWAFDWTFTYNVKLTVFLRTKIQRTKNGMCTNYYIMDFSHAPIEIVSVNHLVHERPGWILTIWFCVALFFLFCRLHKCWTAYNKQQLVVSSAKQKVDASRVNERVRFGFSGSPKLLCPLTSNGWQSFRVGRSVGYPAQSAGNYSYIISINWIWVSVLWNPSAKHFTHSRYARMDTQMWPNSYFTTPRYKSHVKSIQSIVIWHEAIKLTYE